MVPFLRHMVLFFASSLAIGCAAESDSLSWSEDSAFVDTATIWPRDAAIPVCWLDSAASFGTEQKLVEAAIARTWGSAGVPFVGWGACSANAQGIRIGVSDAQSTSFIGTDANLVEIGKPTMSLNFTFRQFDTTCSRSKDARRVCIEFLAIHEFGHAIGFNHEQDRSDTPEGCLASLAADGISADPNVKGVMIGRYDPNSVMNYCSKGVPVLSKLDRAAARKLYGSAAGETCGRLVGGKSLTAGAQISSCNGTFRLILQGDGNLVLYRGDAPLWNTRTSGSSGSSATMQPDGNFVLYGSAGALWNAGTSGNPGAELRIQNDGNLVVYGAAGKALWQSGTAGR